MAASAAGKAIGSMIMTALPFIAVAAAVMAAIIGIKKAVEY